MTFIVLEGKRVRTDRPAIGDDDVLRHREESEIGSALLRDAILRAKGYTVPERPKKVRKAVPPRHLPTCCEACGAPLKPTGKLVSHIQAEVASYYGIPLIEMTSARRSFDVAHPRQVAMYLAAELTPKSLPEIGRRFGGRDHTTVIWAIRAVKARIADDPEVEADVEILREMLA